VAGRVQQDILQLDITIDDSMLHPNVIINIINRLKIIYKQINQKVRNPGEY
jgi:hypothetical protein